MNKNQANKNSIFVGTIIKKIRTLSRNNLCVFIYLFFWKEEKHPNQLEN